MRTLPLLLTALFLGAPALALPSDFSLAGREGRAALSGSLELQRGSSPRAKLNVQTAYGTLVYTGPLTQRGTRLEASFGAAGAAGRLAGRGSGQRWKLRIRDAGLQVRVELERGKRSLWLAGRHTLGARHAGHEALIRRFYEAFARSDAGPMRAAYAADARFSDPVFPSLSGTRAGNMWAMLCGSKPKITFSGIQADGRYGKARWEARYEILGRPIHNVIEASFEFAQGKIVHHVDSFSFARWSEQAYGKAVSRYLRGAALGLTRATAGHQLRSFEKKQGR